VTRKATLEIVAAILLASVAAYWLIVCTAQHSLPPLPAKYAQKRVGPGGVIDNALVGQSEQQISEGEGEPDSDREGYHSLGLYRPPSLPPGAIRTLIFDRRHGGTLWVWLERREEEWVCFESCWFEDGVQF
jgi:hypothetical protein